MKPIQITRQSHCIGINKRELRHFACAGRGLRQCATACRHRTVNVTYKAERRTADQCWYGREASAVFVSSLRVSGESKGYYDIFSR